jgi:hypothetical protein
MRSLLLYQKRDEARNMTAPRATLDEQKRRRAWPKAQTLGGERGYQVVSMGKSASRAWTRGGE